MNLQEIFPEVPKHLIKFYQQYNLSEAQLIELFLNPTSVNQLILTKMKDWDSKFHHQIQLNTINSNEQEFESNLTHEFINQIKYFVEITKTKNTQFWCYFGISNVVFNEKCEHIKNWFFYLKVQLKLYQLNEIKYQKLTFITSSSTDKKSCYRLNDLKDTPFDGFQSDVPITIQIKVKTITSLIDCIIYNNLIGTLKRKITDVNLLCNISLFLEANNLECRSLWILNEKNELKQIDLSQANSLIDIYLFANSSIVENQESIDEEYNSLKLKLYLSNDYTTKYNVLFLYYFDRLKQKLFFIRYVFYDLSDILSDLLLINSEHWNLLIKQRNHNICKLSNESLREPMISLKILSGSIIVIEKKYPIDKLKIKFESFISFYEKNKLNTLLKDCPNFYLRDNQRVFIELKSNEEFFFEFQDSESFFAKQLICPICTECIIEPVSLVTCGHLFCLKCIQTYFNIMQKNDCFCPLCKCQTSSFVPNLLAKSLLHSVMFLCPMHNNGCTSIGTREELTKHLDFECKYFKMKGICSECLIEFNSLEEFQGHRQQCFNS